VVPTRPLGPPGRALGRHQLSPGSGVLALQDAQQVGGVALAGEADPGHAPTQPVARPLHRVGVVAHDRCGAAQGRELGSRKPGDRELGRRARVGPGPLRAVAVQVVDHPRRSPGGVAGARSQGGDAHDHLASVGVWGCHKRCHKRCLGQKTGRQGQKGVATNVA